MTSRNRRRPRNAGNGNLYVVLLIGTVVATLIVSWVLVRMISRKQETRTPFVRLARVHAIAAASDGAVTAALAGSIFFSISPEESRGRVALALLLTLAAPAAGQGARQRSTP